MILNRAIITAGFVSEGAGNPTLAQPSCSCDEEVLIAIDPVADDEPQRQRGRWRGRAGRVRGAVRKLMPNTLFPSSSMSERSSTPFLA